MIESITATIPVTGQSYTDLRPTVSAESIQEYREELAKVGKLAGNEAFVNRISNSKAGKEKICTEDGCLYLDRTTHEYEDEDGVKFRSGSTWAGTFALPFDTEKIAPKTAEKRLMTTENVLAMWEMKGQVSIMLGNTVHKAMELAIKYGEMPNNPRLASLAQDYLDQTHDDNQVSEQFVCSFDERLCGIIDALVDRGSKHVLIRDFKTGDIYKRVSLTEKARQLFPDLKNEQLSIYQLQLSFYAHILRAMGYKVDGMEIWAVSADDAWEVIKINPLKIEEAL